MEFVALRSFVNYIDAHIVLGRLKNEGVDCWLKNENINTLLMPLWGTAAGTIQLMVSKAQEQKASYILKIIDEESEE